MGAAFGSGFQALANELAVMGLGVATLGLVALGLGLMFSWFDRGVMMHLKDGLLRIIGGSALVGGAGQLRHHAFPPLTWTSSPTPA
jgi:hypothetical protein